MNHRMIGIAVLLIGCAACNQQQPERDSNFVTLVPKPGTPAPKAPPPPALHPPPPPGTGPDGKTPLSEPDGPIDPKSAEAAGQVAQHYGALIEQGRWREAEALWGDAKSAAAFSATLKTYASVHLEIGELGQMEGAAGSSYVDLPVTFYGPSERGGSYRRPATIILRRVNDVPGSTAAQRRWHIERIDWGSGG